MPAEQRADAQDLLPPQGGASEDRDAGSQADEAAGLAAEANLRSKAIWATSGTMHVVHEDGTELDLGPGNAYEILPGHDAWVVGPENCVAYEFESRAAEEYARP
jgi:hypothetical protein